MKANELMIGNFAWADGSIVLIREIGEKQTSVFWDDKRPERKFINCNFIPNDWIRPIPITEELLLKIGFDEPFYRTDTKCSTHVRSLENGCWLWARFHVPRKYWYLDVVNEDGFILSSGKVDYLHQLQNLCNIAGLDVELNIDKL